MQKRKKCTRNKMHERNKNKMRREVQAVIWGVQELKKVELGQKKKWTGAGPGECEPNRSGSSEPDRFRISYLKAIFGFFSHFFFFFLFLPSFFFISRERGSAFSLESGHLLRLGGRFRRGGRRATRGRAAAPEVKTSFFLFFFLSTSFYLLFLILGSKIVYNHHKSLDLKKGNTTF